MLKRIGPVGVLAAALLIALMSAPPARATDDSVSNYQISRTRDLPTTPGDRIVPVATPTPGDDDMPNRSGRRSATIPQSSSVQPVGQDSPVHHTWYLDLWQQILKVGSRAVSFVKA